MAAFEITLGITLGKPKRYLCIFTVQTHISNPTTARHTLSCWMSPLVFLRQHDHPGFPQSVHVDSELSADTSDTQCSRTHALKSAWGSAEDQLGIS